MIMCVDGALCLPWRSYGQQVIKKSLLGDRTQMVQLVKLDLPKEGKVTADGNYVGENVKLFCCF